jgi:hypothetical protein
MRAGRWSFEQKILSVLNHSSLPDTQAIPFDSDMLKAAFSGGGVCTDMNMNEKFTGRYLYVNMTDPGREEYTYCSREMSLLMIMEYYVLRKALQQFPKLMALIIWIR